MNDMLGIMVNDDEDDFYHFEENAKSLQEHLYKTLRTCFFRHQTELMHVKAERYAERYLNEIPQNPQIDEILNVAKKVMNVEESGEMSKNAVTKAITNLLGEPSVLIPFVTGSTIASITWAIDGSPLMLFGGVAGSLIGAGIFATKVIFGLEKITEDAYERMQNQSKYDKLSELQGLYGKIKELEFRKTYARMPEKTKESFVADDVKQLVSIYEFFIYHLAHKINDPGQEILVNFDNLLKACIEEMKIYFSLLESSKLKEIGDNLKVSQKIKKGVKSLKKIFPELKQIADQSGGTDLDKAAEELEKSVQLKKKIDKEISSALEGDL